MAVDLVIALGVVAGLSERGRTIAHLALLLVLLTGVAAAALVYLIRRRRADQTREQQRTPE